LISVGGTDVFGPPGSGSESISQKNLLKRKKNKNL
jgi:hypothetical protein